MRKSNIREKFLKILWDDFHEIKFENINKAQDVFFVANSSQTV